MKDLTMLSRVREPPHGRFLRIPNEPVALAAKAHIEIENYLGDSGSGTL
jgi:hypothetical protein